MYPDSRKGRVNTQQEWQSIQATKERQGIQAAGTAGYPGSRKGRISRQQEREDIHEA